jgi:mannose-1-phosphate guanylyltransferase/phosphomannomutase
VNIFILGAGLGTRLRPITDTTPKPLIKLLNKEMINYNFELFYKNGYKDFIVNIAYLKEKFLDFIPILPVNIKYSVEDKPLGTGGGVKYAKKLFNIKDDTIIMNGDIFYDFDMKELTNFYLMQNSPLAAMVLKPDSNGNVTVRNNIVTSIRGIKSNDFEKGDKKYLFTGLHIISPEFLNLINDFCIIDTYIKSLNTNKIFAYIEDNNNYWSDIGTIDSYNKTSKYLLENYRDLKVLSILN